jgi:hypothetical protein
MEARETAASGMAEEIYSPQKALTGATSERLRGTASALKVVLYFPSSRSFDHLLEFSTLRNSFQVPSQTMRQMYLDLLQQILILLFEVGYLTTLSVR